MIIQQNQGVSNHQEIDFFSNTRLIHSSCLTQQRVKHFKGIGNWYSTQNDETIISLDRAIFFRRSLLGGKMLTPHKGEKVRQMGRLLFSYSLTYYWLVTHTQNNIFPKRPDSNKVVNVHSMSAQLIVLFYRSYPLRTIVIWVMSKRDASTMFKTFHSFRKL